MNITYNWLKDLVEINLPPQELAENLTRVGLAVEGIHEFADDFVFDIDLTSNRGDCLSHLGVAREIHAVQGSKFKIQDFEIKSQMHKTENQKLVVIQDTDLCHRFTARIIRGVKIAPSPDWLIKRLEAIGERAINNVADITNYVMHELGNPMHSFDLDKLNENRIVVRRARTGETIQTLDEITRKLDETMLAICDAEKPIAVAGVMGGFETSITDDTTDVLIEVAYFDRTNIRQTSRNLKLSTEASHHFERGVDVENLIRASKRATELICELAGGTAEDFVDVYPTKFVPKEIGSKNLRFAVKRLTGLEVGQDEVTRILNSLGIEQKSEAIYVSPTWRHDLAIEVDLVEEIVRIVGYDQIGEELPSAKSAGEYQPTEARKKSLRNNLVNFGFNEAISYSFIDARHDEKFEFVPNFIGEDVEEKFVTLNDSIIEGASRMRPSLLPGLLDAVRTNFNFQKRDLKLFEIGKVFSASEKENELPNERELFALVVTGNEFPADRASSTRELNFYDAKGALESAINALNLPKLEFESKNVAHLQRGQSAGILLNGISVGTIGKLSDEISGSYKFRQPVFVAEIDLQTLLKCEQNAVAYKPLPIYPSIVRDISLLAKRGVSFAEIKRAIESESFELLRSVEFVDVYEGKGVAEEERSITIRLEYRSNQRTLSDEDVDAIHQKILQNVELNLGAKQRL